MLTHVESPVVVPPPAAQTPLLARLSQKITDLLDDGKQKNAIAALDGVRALACIIIVFFHANVLAREAGVWRPILDLGSLVGSVALAGECGVQLFFVLSGFLLFLPYAKALLFDGSWPSIRRFYLRRIFRIVPAYYVCLLLLILLFKREYLQAANQHELWLFLTFRMDFHEAFQHIDGPFWTLAVEFQFYVLLPFLAWGMSILVRRGNLRWRLASLFGCLVLMMIWGIVASYWGHGKLPLIDTLFHSPLLDALHPYIFSGKGKSLEVFALGMLLATLYIYAQQVDAERWRRWSYRLSPWLLCSGLVILMGMMFWHFYMWYFNYALHPLDSYRELLVQSWDQWQGFFYGLGFALCIFALLHGPALLKRPLELAPLRWIGLVSFSLYMWHVPLMELYTKQILPQLKHAGLHRSVQYGLFWCWILSVILAIVLISYLLVEKPGMKFGRKLEAKIFKKRSQSVAS